MFGNRCMSVSVRPERNEIARVLKLSHERGLLGEEHTAAIFYARAHLANRMQRCRAAFPVGALHAIAVKALPFPRLLHLFRDAGFGAEVASLGELEIALKTGFAPATIVFDSPAKTRQELDHALSLGCRVNADNFDELERIAGILDRRRELPAPSIGLRINPQVGAGTIASTSVADAYSKFGVPMEQQNERIVAAYARYPWLDAIHCHIGSQGCAIEMLVEGAVKLDALIKRINGRRAQPIRTIDIGGGLPAAYHAGAEDASFDVYASALRRALPHWWNAADAAVAPRLITEFGRHMAANAAWAVSDIEYVKPSAGLHTVIAHLGADMFLRKCYRPDDWHHDISILDPANGTWLAPGDTIIRVAGPLCFAGDIIGEVSTAAIPTEDHKLIIHDVGAYTVSMWSRYNSRPMPAVFAYDTATETIETIKQKETPEDLFKFWC